MSKYPKNNWPRSSGVGKYPLTFIKALYYVEEYD
jgi:hypothetical protein